MGRNQFNIHASIIEKCKNGNKRAQVKLYGLYCDAMFNVSFRIVKDDAEAEDVVQESFITAFAKLDMYKGEVAFGAWLKKIVVNRSLDQVRKRKIEFEEINERVHDGAEENISTEPQYSVEMVKAAIEELPEKYRIIVTLYLIEGYDHEEISDILGISYALSRTQYHRAKEKVRQIVIKKQEIEVYG